VVGVLGGLVDVDLHPLDLAGEAARPPGLAPGGAVGVRELVGKQRRLVTAQGSIEKAMTSDSVLIDGDDTAAPRRV
jgi:hypothetical protein